MLYLELFVKHMTPTRYFELFVCFEIIFDFFFLKEKTFAEYLFIQVILYHLYIIKQRVTCCYCSCINDRTELAFKLIVRLHLNSSEKLRLVEFFYLSFLLH